MVAVDFQNQQGLFAFGSLIIFIILYLFRPKPLEKPIPSLMFIFKDKKQSLFRSFFQNLLKNLLFFLQLLAILALCFAIAQPILTLDIPGKAEHTVIVIDNSASMGAKHDGKTRLQKAVEMAKSNLDGSVSIVLAQSPPILLVQRAGRQEAKQALDSIIQADTQTDLGDAIQAGADLLSLEKGRILVYSDFLITDGPDPLIIRQSLNAKGKPVSFFTIRDTQENVGFIDLSLDKDQTKLTIKNFNPKTVELTVSQRQNNSEISSQKIKILAKSVEPISFKSLQGQTQYIIEEQDDLDSDNVLYTQIPDVKKPNVLLISSYPYQWNSFANQYEPERPTNVKTCLELSKEMSSIALQKCNNKQGQPIPCLREQSPFIKVLSGLESLKRVNCNYFFPPILPDDLSQYDVVILHGFENQFTPVFFRNLKNRLKEGKALIVIPQNIPADNELLDLLPVENAYLKTSNSSVRIVNDFPFLQDVSFGETAQFIAATPKKDVTVILEDKLDSSVIFANRTVEGMRIYYYGNNDQKGTFRISYTYPIFWGGIFDSITGTADLNNYNFKTGQSVLSLDDKGNLNRVILSKAGFNEADSKIVSANLLNEKESDISSSGKSDLIDEITDAKSVIQKDELGLEKYLLPTALILLLLEFIYLKFRGEI